MRILVVDDDPGICDSLERALRREEYAVTIARDGEEAISAVEAQSPDAVILDVSMPKLDGLSVCRRLRAAGSRVPILVLTARHSLGDKVAGLDAGADDYLAKPFALEELLARLRAIMRRAAPADGSNALTLGDLTLDAGTRVVTRAGLPIELTRTEYQLLEMFLRNPGQVLTRELIFDRVWGYDFGVNSNSLDVYIGYLRRKTEAGDQPRLIHTVRGVGYVARAS
ncbi:MAG: response regulator transcription factor [Dehalococcoidia bacterium]|nr:MAG: response regulator transcription factor [Dehalococcoidia bacterium]